MMINKHTFNKLLMGLRDYSDSLTKFEEGLQTNIEDGWLVNIFENTIEALTDSFFGDEELQVPYQCRGPVLGTSWDTINALIYHFCLEGDFGRNSEPLGDLLIIQNKNKEIIEKYNGYTSHELHTIICRFLNRVYEGDDPLTYIFPV